jgi:predicted esterase YcpF (UPF0227 family)
MSFWIHSVSFSYTGECHTVVTNRAIAFRHVCHSAACKEYDVVKWQADDKLRTASVTDKYSQAQLLLWSNGIFSLYKISTHLDTIGTSPG